MPRLTAKTRALLDKTMKENIGAETLKLVCEKGVDGWTMNDLATRLDIAKGTLYNYFTNKDDLIESALEQHFFKMESKIEEQFACDRAPDETIMGIAFVIFEHFHVHRKIHDLLFPNHAIKHFKKRKKKRAMMVKKISTLVTRGIEQGIFRTVDPIATAEVFLGSIREFHISTIEKQAVRTPEEQVKLISNIVIDGIRNKP